MIKITQLTCIFASAVLLTGCTQAKTEISDTGSDQISERLDQITPVETDTKNSTSKENISQSESSSTKEFTIEVSQWRYSPDVIEVHKGDTVIIHALSKDVPHSLTLPEFFDEDRENGTGGINVLLMPGEEEVITFIADKKGEFRFGCDVVCGSGHTSMHGTLKVL